MKNCWICPRKSNPKYHPFCSEACEKEYISKIYRPMRISLEITEEEFERRMNAN